MIRLGLCCMFRDQPIKFRTTTATAIGKMNRPDTLARLSALCMANVEAKAKEAAVLKLKSELERLRTHKKTGSSYG